MADDPSRIRPSRPAARGSSGGFDRDVWIVVAVFVAVVALHLYINFTALEMLSWTRSYVAGEGMWSRGQKDAIIALHRYARTTEVEDFTDYRRAVAVPLANRRGREELQHPDPNMDVVVEAFTEAGHHPDDIAGFIAAFRAFYGIAFIEHAVKIWEQGDRLLERLDHLATALDQEIRSANTDPRAIDRLLAQIDDLNNVLTALEVQFSTTLSDGARWLKHLIMTVALAVTTLLVLGAVFWSYRLTARMRMTQQALQQSEEKYRSLVQHATYGMYRSTVGGQFVAVNPALVEMLGYANEDEVLSLALERDLYLYPEDRARLIAKYHQVAQIDDVEVDWKRRDGTPITVRLSGRPLVDAGSLAGFEMIVEDVTERKVLEEQLRQSQKMEAVGRLTGGIAHDLNNLLTVILANADLLAVSTPRELPERGERSELDELRDAARRGAAMIRKLLAFSRREKLVRSPTDLARVVAEASRVLRRVLPESIEMEVVVDDHLPTVNADAGAVEQMLVNLATNARDAMPDGGRLRIDIYAGDIDEAFRVKRGWGREGAYVCVRMSDTGTGMDTETKRRIFEPFFTTKAPGAGTGLGMAMIYGLVKQHDGYIDVISDIGAGTTVTLFFPVSGVPQSSLEAPKLLDVLPRGQETILVVEDESAIRAAVRRGLERLGYRILLASNGQEGLDVFRRHADEIQLVLTDVVMPKMTGTKMYRQLQREFPDVKVLFMSGYMLRDGFDSTGLDSSLPLVRKPWTLAQLAGRIREIFDQHAAATRS